ncbi:hypothetical protein [Hymenobacter sp. CRA2]|uniref:hypothetical protein n=1 Tax=Hymenobacter sp. CRA2 TaxID=1955620 RepID=UPI00098E90E0|nr:hypothetical protein [Hymenobacter sp. CRA2]OON69424.1 hypothetical protein B0919_09105 [Hymenobacter sp. CRA2]
MKIELLAGAVPLGVCEAQVIDAAMGVIGGQLLPAPAYFGHYQSLFRAHLQQPNWPGMQTLGLKAVMPLGNELEAAGGICITDVEGFHEIQVEFCGVDHTVLTEWE